MNRLRPLMLFTDFGFVLYWLITGMHLIPQEYLFKDYSNPVLIAWNWSFLPLDLLISLSGFLSIAAHSREHPAWRTLTLISLVLTSVSGLMAIAFWTMNRDFDLLWWAPNLFLLLYPIFFIPRITSAGWEPNSSPDRIEGSTAF